jgi:hypothetical protein
VYNIQQSTFNDGPIISKNGNPQISQLIVRSGDVLDSIWAFNAISGGVLNMLQHGGNGGQQTILPITSGNPVVKVVGYTGIWFGWDVVLQVTIFTADGTPHGPYGTMANSSSSKQFTLQAPAGQSIVAFSGSTIKVPEATGGESCVIQNLDAVYA